MLQKTATTGRQPVGLAVSDKMSFEAIADDARRMMDDGHWMMAIAHSEPLAHVS